MLSLLVGRVVLTVIFNQADLSCSLRVVQFPIAPLKSVRHSPLIASMSHSLVHLYKEQFPLHCFFVLKIDLRSLTSPRMLCILNCLYLLLWSLIALLMALLLISLHCCFTLLSMLSIRSMNALISSSSSSFLRPFLALGIQDQATAFLSLDSLVVPLVTFSSSRFPPTHL